MNNAKKISLKVLAISVICLSLACAKKVGKPLEPPALPGPKISFLFINRLGFRQDSTLHGHNDTVFKGVCLGTKYFSKLKNITNLYNTCYNRDYSAALYRLSDSILLISYEPSIGDKYGYEIELAWKYPVFPYTTKYLKFNTKNFDLGDTVKIVKDTLIKFIWPVDTNSGKFILKEHYP